MNEMDVFTASGVTCRDDITVGVLTGKAYLTDISCKSVISSGTTGSISLSNIIATNRFSVERSTEDVEFKIAHLLFGIMLHFLT